jgi:hypothetical protein
VHLDGYNGLLYFTTHSTTDILQRHIWQDINEELGHIQRSSCGFYRQALDDHICHFYIPAITTSSMYNQTEEKIGVIVNKASIHTSTKVLEWIEEKNKSKMPQKIYEFIDQSGDDINLPAS